MSEQRPADPSSPSFVPVCAIGASAGGVGALQTLFRLLPDDLGLAYVVVVHLSPDHPSAMHEILGACTRMPVLQVNDGPTLRANCVYVIAPDSELVIDGDNVQSRPFSDLRSRRAPIDMFFRSIAAGRGDGIAVVLTGAGSDGALGVRAIKEAGGIVMVQEPAEAGFPSMPRNAIATGVADVVAPLARLAERIADAARSKEAVRSLDEDGAANEVRRIVAFLRTRIGHDFSGYKRSTVLRRIQRRMQVCQIAALGEYLLHLRSNPDEAKELLSDLLISVTMFFRDPGTFVTLGHRVVRPLIEAWTAGETEDELRAWVVGCATGEEAYSLAILLLEEAEQLKVKVPIQIFATDLDEGALAAAREGRYPRSIEADVSSERLKRFFVDEGTHYRIDRRVRDLVLFATHSVVREPPFMRLDLITCRNVLIYLERALQQHVNSIFRYGLKADGYLFLGTAETADTSDNHFAVVDRDARIYRALPTRPDFVPSSSAPAPWSATRPALIESRLATARLDAGEVLGESHAAALEASAPPSALVGAAQSVLHLSPTAGRFILLSAGPLSGRLPSIVRPELRLDLKLALDRAFERRQPTITRPIDVQMEGETRRVSLHVAPLPNGDGAASRAIVYFLDSGAGRTEGGEAPAAPADELQHLHGELKAALEAELAGRMRHESAVQELRASNEELQSLNEEYRSTAEELETSKEELQSINEELQTVNAELKSKLGIISAAHNDLQNLTASSEIGTLFLDLDLRIRMFTPRVAELINVAPADIGRPITNFTHRLEYDDIAADVRRVARDLTPLETEVRTVDRRWFNVRIRPYQTLSGAVEGAVVTFDDNTDRKLAREALRESEEKYRSLFETIDEGFTIIEMVRDDAGRLDFVYREANAAFARVTGFLPRAGQRARELTPDIEDDWLRYYDRVASSGVAEEKEGFQVDAARWYRTNANRLGDAGSPFLAVVFADISERKRVERMLRESESWLAAQKDAFRAAMDGAPLDRSLGILAAWMAGNAHDGRRCAFYTATEGSTGSRAIVGPSDGLARPVDGLAISPESLTWGLAMARGEPVVTRDVLADPAWRDWTGLAGEHGYRGCWSFPVETATGQLIGSFAEYLPEPGEPGARDLELATAVTQAAAIILSRSQQNAERSRAEAALRESEGRQAFLLDLSDALRPLTDPAEVQVVAMRLLAEQLGAMRASYFEIEDDDDTFHLTALHGRDAPPLPERMRLSDFSPALGDAYRAGRTLAVPDTTVASEFVADPAAYAAIGVGAWAAVPLLRNGRLTAWIGVHSRAPRDWGAAVLKVLDDVAERTWGAVERTRAEAALNVSEARFRTLAETAPALIWQHDAAGENVFINRYFADYTGLSAEEVNGERWRTLVHPDDAEAYLAAHMGGMAEQRPFHSRNRIHRHDGAWRWFENHAQPLFDHQGRYVGHVGVSTDVDATTQAELSLRESEERFQQFAQASASGLWIRNADTLAMEYASPAVATIYGTGPDALLGDVARWTAAVVPEDHDTARRQLEDARRGRTVVHEFRIRRSSDGAIRWIRNTDFPLSDGDRIQRIGGIAEDITAARLIQEELAHFDERLRSAVEVGRVGLWDWNVATGEVHWSDEHYRMQGYSVGEVTPTYDAWVSQFHPDDRAATEAALRRAMAERAEYVREVRVVHPDGSIHWHAGRGRFFYDDRGEPLRMIGAVVDMTERREWEERQKVLVAELQHRTRNLLGVIRSMSDKTARASADLPDFRSRFRDRLQALSRVQGLLSRLDDHDRVTFDELIRTELAVMNGNVEQAVLSGPSGIRLRSSTVQTLALAVHELATNAMKYGALGQPSGRLAVTWWFEPRGEGGKPWLHIDWRESGVTMPPPGAAPTGTGQGRELIEKALPYQLKAQTSYALGTDGVHCTIAIPVSASSAEAEHDG